jgi:hypothetical protein
MMSGMVTVSSCAQATGEPASSNAKMHRNDFISKYQASISNLVGGAGLRRGN